MTLEERIIKVLEDVKKCFPEELDKIRHTIENIQEENILTKELGIIEERIEKYKNTYINTYYSNENNETYYAEIEEDDYIYDTTKTEEETLVEKTLNEPTKFVDGTFIPYPREQRPNELNSDYANYLETLYSNYGYKVQYDENGKPIYPHEIKKEQHEVIETEETFEDKFGIDKFLSSRYNFTGNLTDLETTIIVSYLKAYKEYLTRIKLSNSESIDYIEKKLKETEEAINDIQENKVLL